ncbi:MAG: holo-ACP synthase, partial [bacterium]|nr:holo-ACP synthase [bacterium]
MIKGMGVDIIDVPRIKKMVDKGRRFFDGIFTPLEIEYSEARHKKEIHFAARFAAKEAFFKAMGTGWRDGMKWTDIEVENDELGKPHIRISGKTLEKFNSKGCSTINLSISHTKEYAVAFVIVE